MAAASSGVWLPIFRAKSPEGCRRLARMFIIDKRDSSSASTDIPLLQKLLKSQVSRIKETLDSEVISEANEFPWAALLSSLNSSAPQKANLVIEWKLEKLIKENPKNQDSYSQLISLCSNIRNLPTAMLIFAAMEAQGVQPTPSIFNALISTSLSSGNLLTALSLFEIMEGSESYKPDSNTYNAFISAYSNMGNKNATESWFAAKRASGFSADVLTYGSLIQCCIKSNHIEDAERYFEEMMLAGVNPNEPVMQNMLVLYCKQRNCVRVKEILKFTLNGNWQIDRSMAKKVVNLYRELGRVEELEELLVTLAESNQTSEVLSLVHCSIIRFYAETDRLDDVEYSVGRMLKNGISFSCSEDVEKVICCYFRREAYDRLELFLECIKDSYKFTRSNYDLLCAGYKRAGLLERLNAVVNEMKVAGFV
ncbi:hypothetical protein CDL12_24056 [Handroanthus impetiginosus]|uniref:Pentacotripeptide-repeat region of PRORP domain-containing protein n=1 Tax=Handroanthus impetiginosus TaxID=429701 RepID=A0A2G9GE00_9LAMI|nr:hypothetical protein CDL12_24056 [Handroanthus impetiginosus]